MTCVFLENRTENKFYNKIGSADYSKCVLVLGMAFKVIYVVHNSDSHLKDGKGAIKILIS